MTEKYPTWDNVMGVPAPDGVKQFISRPLTHRPVNFIPRTDSQSETAVRIADRLVHALSDVLTPTQVSVLGRAWPGVPEGLDRLYTSQGMLPNPAGTPVHDATILTREIAEGRKVAGTEGRRIKQYAADLVIGPREERIIKHVMRRLCIFDGPTSVPVNRLSTVGLPHMTRSAETKAAIGRMWIRDSKRLRKMVEAKAFRALYDEGILFMYFNGYRFQADRTMMRDGVRVSLKDRVVYTWDDKFSHMNKTIVDGPAARKMVASRTRSFAAASMGGTFPHRVLARSAEEAMYRRYPEMCKHRGADDVAEKTSRFAAMRKYDVTQHDQSMPTLIIEYLIQLVHELVSPWAADMLLYILRGPMLAHNDHAGGKGARVRGNPFSLSGFTAWYINASGNPWTSWIAKAAGIAYGICALVAVGLVLDDPDDWDRVMEGRHPRTGLLNMGDNLVVGVTDLADEPLLDRIPDSLYLAELDHAESFLGLVPATANGSVSWLPNILSYLLKWFGHDRDVGPPYRVFWASGWFERKLVYNAHPLFADVDRITNEVCQQVLGTTMDAICEHHRRREPQLPILENEIDREFMQDPNIIHYRVSPHEVSPHLLGEGFITFSQEDVTPLYNSLFGKV